MFRSSCCNTMLPLALVAISWVPYIIVDMAERELEDLFGGSDETPAMRTKRIFEENAPFAAAAIIDIMNTATNDNTRLRAAQEVVSRVLGPVGKDDATAALDEFLSGIERLANGGHE